MEILRKFKNIQPVNRNSALSFIHCLQIQILGVFILSLKIPVYREILKLQEIFPSSISQNFVLCNFLFNVFIFLYFGIQIATSQGLYQRWTNINKKLLKTLKIMPYVACVQIMLLNAVTLQKMVFPYAIFAVINIVAFVGQTVIIKTTNISYRFLDVNYLERKNNCLLCWLIIIPIVCSAIFFSSQQTILFLCLRSLTQLYLNFFTLENQVIRKYEYFYPFFTLAIAITFLLERFLQFDTYSNLVLTTCSIVLSIYGAMSLTKCMMLFSLRYQLGSNKHLFLLQNQATNIESFSSKQVDENQIEKFLLFYRILLNVYISRIALSKKDKSSQVDSRQPVKNFDFWWMNFNLTILKHKVQCSQITCMCKNFQSRSKQNTKIEEQLFLRKVQELLIQMIKTKTIQSMKLSIVEKYFLIEFDNKPIKSYYQLIELELHRHSLSEQLQIQRLIMQTREIFTKNFLIEKVQNQNLDIEPIIEFQQKIKQMREQMSKVTFQYINFYQSFGKKHVQIDELKVSSRGILEFKNGFDKKIETYLTKFDRNLEFLTFCLIYYKYLNDYTGKLNLIERKSQNYLERKNRFHLNQKKQIDVFDPYFGAIKIDLVFSPGKVICITKNLCGLLGFKQDDLIGKKANGLMPTIFARFHDKFINRFIEKGKLNIVKKKERTLLVKAANKFIAPITVRLKVQYLMQHSFCSSALINALSTKSQFILMNNYGKIEEISENIFNKLFKPAVNDDLSKIKKLCVYKMLLSLNYLIKNVSQCQNTVHQGIIMTSDKQKTLISFFKSIVFNHFLEETQTFHQIQGKSSTSTSQNFFQELRQGFDYSDDEDKLKSDLKQSFRQFLKFIRLDQIKAYRISFKFFEIVTSEFKCKVLQILSIDQEFDEDAIENELARQIGQIGQCYKIQKQQTQGFKTLQSLADNKQSKQTSNCSFHLLKDDKKKKKTQTQIFDEKVQNSLQNFITNKELNTQKNFQFKANELEDNQSSAMNEQIEEQHIKQNITAAFQKKDFIDRSTEVVIGILVLAIALTFLTISIFSMNMEGDYRILQKDNRIVTNMRLNFQFRLAIQQVQHLYEEMNLTVPPFLKIKKQKLIQDLKQIILNSILWIDEEMMKQLYYEKVQLTDQKTSFVENRQILFIMNQIYSIFLVAEQQGQYLANNYARINSHLSSIATTQKAIILKRSEDFQIKIHLTVVIYFILLSLLFIVFFIANKKAVQKQTKVINFLPFLNSKLIKKQLQFNNKLYQHIRQSKPLEMHQIQKMYQAHTVSAIKQIKKFNLTKTNSQNLGSVMPILKTADDNITDSKLLNIMESKESTFTLKNVIFSLVIACLCISLVLYSEIFFSIAHQKFRTYIMLKDTALLRQNIPLRIMALYFTNFHHILTGREPIDFPESFYELAHDSAFQLRKSLSYTEFFQTDMMLLVHQQITDKICKMITCGPTSSLVEKQTLSYMSIHFKFVFDYLRTVKEILPKQLNKKQQISRWIKENNVEKLILTIENVFEMLKASQKDIIQLFDKEIAHIGAILFVVSIVFIPVLIIVILLIRKKFISFVAQKIEALENIYKQLSWNILSSNSYAINYFHQKIKKSKSH